MHIVVMLAGVSSILLTVAALGALVMTCMGIRDWVVRFNR